jgi:hypothetical protein
MALELAEQDWERCAAAARILHALAARDGERRPGLLLLAGYFEKKALRAAHRLGRADMPQEKMGERLWRAALVWLGASAALRWIMWQERAHLKRKRRLIATALRLGVLAKSQGLASDERRLTR